MVAGLITDTFTLVAVLEQNIAVYRLTWHLWQKVFFVDWNVYPAYLDYDTI